MAKINARDWVFQVHDGASTWLEVEEINNWDNDPTSDEEITEGTVFTSAGKWEGQKLQIGQQIELSGFYSRDPVTGVRSPGQARVDTMHSQLGRFSHAQFRFRHLVETQWTVFQTCIFTLTSHGGGNNAFTAWGVRVKRSGAATTAAVV